MFSNETKSGCIINVPKRLKCYDVIDFIGRGSYAVVFKVQQINSQKIYAAKILSKNDMEKRNYSEMITNEINILRSLKHPHIIKFYDSFEVKSESNDDLIVIIEEYCLNGSLFNRIIKRFNNKNEKKRMMKNLIEVVTFLHNQQIAHCDIKPDNILLDENYDIKLTDFGFSKNYKSKYNENKVETKRYSAPEMYYFGKVDFFKADIWSLGVTLYVMERKRFPYDNISKINFVNLRKILKSEKLEFIVNKCLQISPNDRSDANELLKEKYFMLMEI